MSEMQRKISELIPIILSDNGQTDIYTLAEKAGFEKEFAGRELPKLILYLAKIINRKSQEIAVHESLSRKNIKSNLEMVYEKTMSKLQKEMTKEDFELTETFIEKLEGVMKLHDRFAKFEGLNKPDKLSVEINQNYDLSKLTPEEQGEMLRLAEKAEKIEE